MGRLGATVFDVFLDGSVENVIFLQHQSDVITQPLRVPLFQLHTVKAYAALVGTIEFVKQINKDKITILEAIAMANDLNITGIRKNVLVMRKEGNQEVPYRVDLTSAESIYNSPVYYIRQNDVIYVEPNNMAKRGSTVMGSSAYQPGFWFGMIASLISTGALIWAIGK